MLPDAAAPALVLLGAAAVAYLHLRHLGLSAVIVLAPIPGLAAAAVLAAGLSQPIAEALVPAWLYGFAAAFLLADDFILNLLGGAPPRAAARAAFVARWRALLAMTAIAGTACLLPMLATGEYRHGGLTALALLGAGLGIGLMIAPGLLTYDESFVARSNRARERWQRPFDVLIAVARPRWGFSVSGIALVFAVMAAFGARPLVLDPALRGHVLEIAGLIGVIGIAATALAIRDWRASLACLLAVGLVGAIGLWGAAHLGAPFGPEQVRTYGLVLAVAALPLLAAGVAAGGFGRGGDDATLAAARTLVRLAPGLFFLSAGLGTGLLLWATTAGGMALALAAMAGFGGAGALLFQPAFAIVIETLLPRASTRAARYRLE